MSTGFGISNHYYGREEEELVSTGQGNKFSGDMCRDVSCLIIRSIEKDGLGVKFIERETMQVEQIAAVRFVDDNDLIENGNNVNDDMQ